VKIPSNMICAHLRTSNKKVYPFNSLNTHPSRLWKLFNQKLIHHHRGDCEQRNMCQFTLLSNTIQNKTRKSQKNLYGKSTNH